jgi:hypothetical protein
MNMDAQFDEGFGRRREHANIEGMQNLIIDAVTRETTHPMPPLVRNFMSALQSVHGGGKVANEPFTRSHVRVGTYMQFKGEQAAIEQRMRRLIHRLEGYQGKTGYLFFLVKRGGEPVGIDEQGNTVYSATCYTDFLKPVADAAVQRARASELWKGNEAKRIKPNPGDALAAQVAWALAQLPRVSEEPPNKGKDSKLSLTEYEKQSEEQIRAAVEKRLDGITERGGDINRWLEKLEVQISRLRRSRAKTVEAEQRETMRERMEAREAEHRALDAEMMIGSEGGYPPTKVIPPQAANPSSSEDTPGTLAAALDYAARGIPVFPVRQNKAPYTPRGFKDATCDELTIRGWWQKWPGAGIGIPTGVASGWLVLDVDPRHGGGAAVARLLEEYGDLPETLLVETGGGGYHLIFEYPELAALGNSRGRLPEGIDVRGEGGYVVAPPSVLASGKPYWRRNDAEPAPVPDWLIKLLTEEKPATALPAATPRSQAKSGAGIGLVIAEGGRNATLFRIGTSLRGRGAELHEIEAELLDINAQRCSPPLPESEVLKVARSAAGYAPNRVAVGV